MDGELRKNHEDITGTIGMTPNCRNAKEPLEQKKKTRCLPLCSVSSAYGPRAC